MRSSVRDKANTQTSSDAEDRSLRQSKAPAEDRLSDLASHVQRAIDFAERWPAAYRPVVFEFALSALAMTTRVAPLPSDASPLTGKDDIRASVPKVAINEPATALMKLAEAVDVDAALLERAVQFDHHGLRIIGRVEGTTKRDLQTRYSLVYCYVQEMGLGRRHIDVEELRSLCLEHGCYDTANFAANSKKDMREDLLREIADRGGKGRKYMATRKGLDLAATLLRAMAQA